MCTLIVAHQIFKDYPIVIAANRDELLDRPSEPPAIRDYEKNIFAPKDLQRGGTWIGVNKFGVFAGLTNRKDIRSLSGRKSRGDIVMEILRHRTARAAYDALAPLSRESFNGFHLIIADKDNMFLIRGDGILMKCAEYTAELLIATNHGIGTPTDEKPPRRVINILDAWRAENLFEREPMPQNLSIPLNLHDEEHYGTCINDSENNYGTKSSSIIRLGEQGFEYWHRERPDANRHVCEADFIPQVI